MALNARKRGLGSMDPDKLRKITSLGGKAAHAQGKAHEWSKPEASVAGKKWWKSAEGFEMG